MNNTFNNNETIQQESQIISQNENIQECLLNEHNQLDEPNHLEDRHQMRINQMIHLQMK